MPLASTGPPRRRRLRLLLALAAAAAATDPGAPAIHDLAQAPPGEAAKDATANGESDVFPGVSNIKPHDFSSHSKLMRKEETVPQVVVGEGSFVDGAVDEPDEAEGVDVPVGYVTRGDDCVGRDASTLRCSAIGGVLSDKCEAYMVKAFINNCSNMCDIMYPCKGFTYAAESQTCYFKRSACKKTEHNGWVFYQKKDCDLSAEACKKAAVALGLSLGDRYQFVGQATSPGDGTFKYHTGCFMITGDERHAGVAYYGQIRGKDIEIEQQLEELPERFAWVDGFLCSGGTAEPGSQDPAMLVEMPAADMSARVRARRAKRAGTAEGDLILEDELERAAHMKIFPEEIELMSTESRASLLHVQSRRQDRFLEENDLEGDALVTNSEEDEEDRQLHASQP